MTAPRLSDQDALALAHATDTLGLARTAAQGRDQAFGGVVTHSRKVFIPLTQLCRDVCHYCTFARSPSALAAPYLAIDEVLRIARQGAAMGCKEALFTLGERPERRWPVAREALAAMGFDSTLAYLRHAAGRVLHETGLLPHLNPGTLDEAELRALRPVAASMGLMIESTSLRLTERGGPHHGSPDKHPAARLATLEAAGRLQIPFTTGLLIGIGETRRERIETLLAIRRSHEAHGHVQEVIVQNFRAKPGTAMAGAPEPSLEELRWTIAVARLVLGTGVSVQAPPNLSPGGLRALIDAGLDDWGGVSPLTPDHVNPEAPWPQLQALAAQTAAAGQHLEERLTIYPRYALDPERWLDPALRAPVRALHDAEGLARGDRWCAGGPEPAPALALAPKLRALRRGDPLQGLLARCAEGEPLTEPEVVRLLQARGPALAAVCQAADALRQRVAGERTSFVVNRNINYTNVCGHGCRFCAFAKATRASDSLRGPAYDLDLAEVQRRAAEAQARGATEVCLQGGIHPAYTGRTYLALLQAVREAAPALHIHAFSPLEVWHGAATLGLPLAAYLEQLQAAGLRTLPGTAAEVLDDEVRARICPDKIGTAQWLQVMDTAHRVGLRSTATLMFGHVERLEHVARHLLRVRAQQQKSGGFTEFVPLPFVHMEAPMGRDGSARRGPSFREALLVHAVGRLVLYPHIRHVQASWVKLGPAGAQAALRAGADDLGGTLMNESITRAAGSCHGQETGPHRMRELITEIGQVPWQRSTLYGEVPPELQQRALQAAPLAPIVLTRPARRARAEQPRLDPTTATATA